MSVLTGLCFVLVDGDVGGERIPTGRGRLPDLDVLSDSARLCPGVGSVARGFVSSCIDCRDVVVTFGQPGRVGFDYTRLQADGVG